LFAFSLDLSAQTYTISGTIVNKGRRNPWSEQMFRRLPIPGTNRPGATTVATNVLYDVWRACGKLSSEGLVYGFQRPPETHCSLAEFSVGKLVLKEKSILMKDAVIKGDAPTAVVRGDTTEISAQSYKVNPDATSEDLVTKMPGVTVDNGTVKAQGETRSKGPCRR